MTDGEPDYQRVASAQRRLRLLVLLTVSMMIANGLWPFVGVLEALVFLASFIAFLATANHLMIAQGRDRTYRGSVLILMFIPFANLFSLVELDSDASRQLRDAGLKVGFFGASRHELRKLLPGACRACGYDRKGLPPDTPCPECGRAPESPQSPTPDA